MNISAQAVALLHQGAGRKRILSRRPEAERDHRPVEPANVIRAEKLPILITEIERRILRACKTVRAIPDREAKFQRIHNCWPDILQSSDEAYGYCEASLPRFRPSPKDVSDMLLALSWAKPLEKQEFRLIWWRSFDISFKHISARLHRSDDTARRWYKDVILKVWHEACY